MMSGILAQSLTLLGIILALILVHSAGSVLACLACRIRVDGVSIFYGKTITTIKTPLCPVSIGCLPCGGSVSFDIEDFDRRSLLVRWTVILSGVLALLVVAGVCLRVDVAMSAFGSGFSQIILGAIAPFERGAPLVAGFFERVNESLLAGCGLLAAKFAAFNLLPIPPLTGGRLLTEIPRNRRKGAVWMWCNVLGAVVSFMVMMCWLAALVNYWRHP